MVCPSCPAQDTLTNGRTLTHRKQKEREKIAILSRATTWMATTSLEGGRGGEGPPSETDPLAPTYPKGPTGQQAEFPN